MTWNAFRKTQVAGYVFIIVGILNWSGNFVAARGLADMVEPATLNLLRWGVATIIFLPFGIRSFWRERHVVARLWKELSFIALTGVSLYDTVIFMAGETTEALNMSLIATLSPLLTALIAQFIFKTKIRPCMYVGIVVSTFGIVLLVTDGQLSRLLALRFATGDLLILSSAIMSAVYNTTISRITGKLSSISLLMSLCLFGTLYIIPLYLWETGGQLTMPVFTTDLIWSLGYLAVCASILCCLFWNEAVQIMGAPKAMLFYYTLPPVSALIAWIVIDEPVTLIQVLSGTIILAGILFALYGGSPKFRRQEKRNYGQPSEVTY
ncbi:EamA family transporter [Pseudodesulfovibrio sp. JC047]|uniref:DMT family transporter n=1 Tax=Pseudodesulfovibrio sp. JC047 TaxID=2683199 RepID=UPI0013D4694F|nr:DMT family transporter [Pseudodesulfovibrio sp. JC047]NDV18329.1 EamA family transporter [Pseudodesulfovibrio sp. JC047]